MVFLQICIHQDSIATGASIISDDGAEFSNLKTLGFDHKAVAMRGDKIKMDSTLPMILKNAVERIHHRSKLINELLMY